MATKISELSASLQTEANDCFCLKHSYDDTKLDNETKADFVARKSEEWAYNEAVIQKVADDSTAASESAKTYFS